jgi:hypothetical protein
MTQSATSTARDGAAGGDASDAGKTESSVKTRTTTTVATGHFQMEDLDRGVVAVKVADGVFVSWRMFGYEYDAKTPSNVAYNLYRGTTKIATVTSSTNYLDDGGTATSTYAVSAVIAGVEGERSASVAPWAQNYLRIPLKVPADGTVTNATCGDKGTAYTYNANDASAGDLDGDGQYEIVLKWDPSNSKDNSQSGCTGNVYIDAYKLDGKQLWRLDLGPNIRAGAHYTQFVVYDFDGDGKAEVALKTAPGTKDGKDAYLKTGPAASDDDSKDYRNASGYIISGPEYLTVFAGPDGSELATAEFGVVRGTSLKATWGDDYGNRVDRFLASAGFVKDGASASGRPSIIMQRGYYTRTTMTAWNWRDGKLTKVWTYDSGSSTNTKTSAYGQGAHAMGMMDVDGDGAQEAVIGAATINSDGTFRCSTGFGHGDALHMGDLLPARKGMEVFMPHENAGAPRTDVHDASTCAVIYQGEDIPKGDDNGRGVCDDITSTNPGAEMWSAMDANLLSLTDGANVGKKPASQNFLIYWDADESRELQNNVSIWKYDGAKTLLSCDACASNNGTKSTPSLTADLLGDWREELVLREADNSGLRVYTTTDVTKRRIYTLMHDPQYRMQVSSEQSAYNQPPHAGFHIGSGMADPPRPDITVR